MPALDDEFEGNRSSVQATLMYSDEFGLRALQNANSSFSKLISQRHLG